MDQYGDVSHCMPSGDAQYNYNFDEYKGEQIVPTDGDVNKTWIFQRTTAGAQGYTFMLRKNGADTGNTFTISHPNVSGSNATAVSYSAGDRMCIAAVRSGSAPSNEVQFWSIIEFEATAEHESIVMMTTCDDARADSGYFWAPSGKAIMRIGTGDARIVMPLPGVISKFYVNLNGAPGAGNTRTFGLSVNDDTSPDITVPISDTAVADSDVAHSTPVALGDWVSIYQTASGTPAQAVMRAGWVYTATDYDLFLIPFGSAGGNIADGTYYGSVSSASQLPTTTETDYQNSGCSDFQIVGWTGLLDITPVAGEGYTVTLREDEAPASEPIEYSIGEGSSVGYGYLSVFSRTGGGSIGAPSAMGRRTLPVSH